MTGLKWQSDLQAVAQAGLEYSENKYDIDRYQQIRQISLEIMHAFHRVRHG